MMSRRDFSRVVGAASLLAIGVGGTGATRRLASRATEIPSVCIALTDEIKVGASKLFRFPTDSQPCILIRLAPDRYVAFSQSCTHLKCPVHFRADTRELVCPCHEGYFSAETGEPTAGPPRRALTQFAVTIKDGQIWVGRLDQEPV